MVFGLGQMGYNRTQLQLSEQRQGNASISNRLAWIQHPVDADKIIQFTLPTLQHLLPQRI